MTVWLDAEQVAERIGVARRTAMAMMLDMHPVTISGSTRKRIRVSEENLERWMIAHSDGKASVKSICTGSKRRLERR
jgi:Tfp pilus assembly protein FimT